MGITSLNLNPENSKLTDKKFLKKAIKQYEQSHISKNDSKKLEEILRKAYWANSKQTVKEWPIRFLSGVSDLNLVQESYKPQAVIKSVELSLKPYRNLVTLEEFSHFLNLQKKSIDTSYNISNRVLTQLGFGIQNNQFMDILTDMILTSFAKGKSKPNLENKKLFTNEEIDNLSEALNFSFYESKILDPITSKYYKLEEGLDQILPIICDRIILGFEKRLFTDKKLNGIKIIKSQKNSILLGEQINNSLLSYLELISQTPRNKAKVLGNYQKRALQLPFQRDDIGRTFIRKHLNFQY